MTLFRPIFNLIFILVQGHKTKIMEPLIQSFIASVCQLHVPESIMFVKKNGEMHISLWVQTSPVFHSQCSSYWCVRCLGPAGVNAQRLWGCFHAETLRVGNLTEPQWKRKWQPKQGQIEQSWGDLLGGGGGIYTLKNLNAATTTTTTTRDRPKMHILLRSPHNPRWMGLC